VLLKRDGSNCRSQFLIHTALEEDVNGMRGEQNALNCQKSRLKKITIKNVNNNFNIQCKKLL